MAMNGAMSRQAENTIGHRQMLVNDVRRYSSGDSHSIGSLVFLILGTSSVPIDWIEELNRFLVGPVGRQPNANERQAYQHVNREKHRHVLLNMLPITIDIEPPPKFVGRPKMKDMNEYGLIDFPRDAFLLFQFQ
jgi:hypothetical protein